ncbi:MAG: hypothetical protein ACI9TH_005160 [Kiritimatiellia bacterium]|jgi:hypothetical protein
MKLIRKDNCRLALVRDGVETTVNVRKCFPWQTPHGFISLADEEGAEIALIQSLDELDAASRQVLKEALDVIGFTLEITRILSLEKEIEIRNWKVETQAGIRRFQTLLDEWPNRVAGGRLIIRDVCGDLYSITDERKLDRKSQHILWALLA